MDFCSRGNHATEHKVFQDSRESWCREHPLEAGPVDEPAKGECTAARRPHRAGAIWYLPRFDQWACKAHLGRIISDADHRGRWHV